MPKIALLCRPCLSHLQYDGEAVSLFVHEYFDMALSPLFTGRYPTTSNGSAGLLSLRTRLPYQLQLATVRH